MTPQKPLIQIASFFLLCSSPLYGIVTSDEAGSHVVTPGEPMFGVNLDGVALVAGDVPGSQAISELIPFCGGALISDRHVISAAHCFDQDKNGIADALFTSFPHVAAFELADRVEFLRLATSQTAIPAEFVDLPADLAVLTLEETAPNDIPRYPLHANVAAFGKIIVTGYGDTGKGLDGVVPGFDVRPTKRAGLNRYEGLRNDEPFPGIDLLVYDFDSGDDQHNTLDAIGIESDLGFGSDEVFAARGDSGAPVFLNGTIAAITAFGGRLDDEPEGSWGEVSFDVPVGTFRDLISSATNDDAVFVFSDALVSGDFNNDQMATAGDIDVLSRAIRFGMTDASFDLNNDDLVDPLDREVWIRDMVSTLPGDADLNQAVDFGDFLALADNFGQSGGWDDGDFDGSGDIQFADFLLLSSNFGQSMPVVVAVPEPAGCVTILVVAFLLLRTRRFDIF